MTHRIRLTDINGVSFCRSRTAHTWKHACVFCPTPISKGAKLLARYCMQYHNLPRLGIHTAPEWPAVVARMQQNMLAMGRAVPGEQTLNEIIGFLQRNARQSK